MKINLVAIIIFISISGCNEQRNDYYKENKDLYFSSFPEEIKLVGQPIEVGKELFVARKLWNKDTLLFIKDSKSNDNLIHIFNLKDGNLITSVIPKGNGPGELTSVGSAYIDDKILYVHDLQTQRLLIVNINSALENKYLFDSKSTLNSQKSKVLKITKINNKIIGELMPAYKNRFQVFDKDLNETSSFGSFPPVEKQGNIDSLRFLVQVLGNLFQGDMITVPEKNLLIVSHPFIDLIEVYDIKNETSILNIIGPEKNYPPKYKMLGDGNGIPCDECKFAYNSIRYFDNKIYALYSGIEYKNRNADESKTLFIFDISGKPLKRITLNVSLTDFILYRADNTLKMYGLSPDSEQILYEFIIDE